jgi:hypothetical protein
MRSRGSQLERQLAEVEARLLAEIEEECLSRDGKRPHISRGISRRQLLKSSAGTAVVSAVGAAGLLELLANREAFAAGTVLAIVGVTRERYPLTETPHRHTFGIGFTVKYINSSTITGDVFGRTNATISTSSQMEENHIHYIRGQNVSLEQLLASGPENNEPGEHTHLVSIE